MKPLAIYVHIPFCVRKCNYCDFLSGPADRESRERYVNALLNEIRSYKNFASDYQVNTIFIGGGTPSSIDAEHIRQIMQTLEDVFHFEARHNTEMEITIEINPGTVTREKLQCYYESGINRISFGLQSANDQELKMLGRIHTFEQFVENYHTAREVGFRNINIDLMSALPGQTMESYERSLNQVMNLNPEHISAYSLIIEEGTPFYDLYGENSKAHPDVTLPSEEVERLMYERTRERMHQQGYERYEISNYAKAGYECRHNCTYWLRGDYLGLGSGAASLISKERFSNVRELKNYIQLAEMCHEGTLNVEENKALSQRDHCEKADQLKIEQYHHQIHAETEHLTIQDEMEEAMFLGLRMMKGVSITKFKDDFEKDVFEIYPDVIKKLMEEQLIQIEGDYISLTQHGIDISNYVMSEFMF